jgi:hypothetical protein
MDYYYYYYLIIKIMDRFPILCVLFFNILFNMILCTLPFLMVETLNAPLNKHDVFCSYKLYKISTSRDQIWGPRDKFPWTKAQTTKY